MRNYRIHHWAGIIATAAAFLIACPLFAVAAQVTLQWDGVSPAPEGYRLFQRYAGQQYDYENPLWAGGGTLCTVTIDTEQTAYFVVRAYAGAEESADSNEVSITASEPPAVEADSDGDSIPDAADAFPDDETEWIDTDQDGTGNNADPDDDADGLPDSWEIEYGLDPLSDDADLDLDGDGISNYDEYRQGDDPSAVVGNSAPQKPVLSNPQEGALVGLTPELAAGDFSDADGDAHARTRYQIASTDDFSDLVLDYTSATQRSRLKVMDLVLDPDTTYFWRVQFIDERNAASEWSAPFAFTTIDWHTAGDADANGIFDDQEIDAYIDLDGDGLHDADQPGMLCLRIPDVVNPHIALKGAGEQVRIVAAKGYGAESLKLALNQPDSMTGMVGFKLHLDGDDAAASVRIYFTQPAPHDAKWYKYDSESGWSIYPHAVFSSDRRAITLLLEDGGPGDQDGVKNGVIVDPSGLGFGVREADGGSSSGGSGEGGAGGCFIDTLNNRKISGRHVGESTLALAGTGLLLIAALSPFCRRRFGRN